MISPARPANPIQVAWRAWLAYAAFVVYGSLLPFDYQGLSFEAAWQAFRNAPFLQLGVESRADWVANGVLYVPVGVLGMLALRGTALRPLAPALALAIACALALAVEFAQVFFPPRTVSRNDLIAEAIGSLVGILAAARVGTWGSRLREAWHRDAAASWRLALGGYAVAYLLYGFFPFDLLLSRTELLDKLRGDNWGWVFARPPGTPLLHTVLQWVAEAALTVPIGALLARGRRGRIGPAVAAGALLGAVIEVGQLFIASGVSQGASVVSRALGCGAGAWAIGAWRMAALPVLRAALARHVRWLLPIYVLLLLPAFGWGRFGWGGWAQAEASWRELHLMPLYYHYFTTEAIALASLCATVLAYAPWAVMAWSRRIDALGAATIAALIALGVEAGKLFMAGTHADPTNVLLAAGSAVLFGRVLTALDRRAGQAPAARPVVEALSPAEVRPAASALAAGDAIGAERRSVGARLGVAGAIVAAVAVAGALWPAWPLAIAVVIVAAALVTAWRPLAALAIVPAAMPVFDVAPWSGRFFVDEFDLLCAGVLAVAWARAPRTANPVDRFAPSRWPFAVFAISLAIGAGKTLLASGAIDTGSLSHYHSAFNGLRILKGAAWAMLFVGLYRTLRRHGGEAADRWFHAGVAAGLVAVVAAVIWERAAFVGLFDFSADHRVTGLFSVMNKGGAYIECYLAVATAMLLVVALGGLPRVIFALLAALLAGAGYALFVTYSRNGYAALAAGLGVAAVAAMLQRRRGRALWAWALLSATAIAVAIPGLSGTFARERISQAAADLQTRRLHWVAAFGLRDDGWATQLFGAGLGSFPRLHAFESRLEPRAGSYRIERTADNAYLRLGPGAAVYLEQIIDGDAGQPSAMSINLRSATAEPPALTVTLCRKWTLTSADCVAAEARGIRAAGWWQTQSLELPALPAARHPMAALMPVKLSIATPSAGPVIDVDNVNLRAGPRALLRNGAFESGMDHWFFATDVDPPWHIHSLPVAVLFDLGWFGVVAGAVLLVAAAAGGLRALRGGRLAGAAAFAGLVAFAVSGTLNTLIDEPRFLWLLCVLALICLGQPRTPKRSAPSGHRTATLE